MFIIHQAQRLNKKLSKISIKVKKVYLLIKPQFRYLWLILREKNIKLKFIISFKV